MRYSMVLLVVGCGLCAPPPAYAQSTAWDVAGGYSFMKGRFDGENLHGFVGSGARYIGWFGLVIEAGANLGKNPVAFRSDLDLVYLSGGATVVFPGTERCTPFAQVLLAAVTGASGGNQPPGIGWLATQAGVGADFWHGRNVGLRIGADYLVSTNAARYNKLRLQVGVVMRRRRAP